MLKKVNKFRPVIIIGAALISIMLIITTVYAAYRFKSTITDEDVIVGNITDVNKSFLSYRKNTISSTMYSTDYYNELKVRQNTAYMLEDIKMAATPTYKNAGSITEFTSGVAYFTYSDGVYTQVDKTVVTEPVNGVTYYVIESTSYSLSSVKLAFGNDGKAVESVVQANAITLRSGNTTDGYTTLAIINNVVISSAGTIISANATNGQSGSNLISYKTVIGSDGLSISLINESVEMTPSETVSHNITCYASIRNRNESYIDYNKIYLNQLGLKFSFTSEVYAYVRIHIQDAWISERIISANKPKVKYAIKDQISGVSPFYILNDNWYYDAAKNVAYLKAIAEPGTNSFTFDVNEGYFYHDTSAAAASTYTTVEISFTLDIVQANRARNLWGADIFDKVYNS